MIEYIGLIGLLAMILYFVVTYFRRKKRTNAAATFYRDHALFAAKSVPPTVRESLQATDNLFCCAGNLTLANGAQIPFYWWEWFTKTRQYVDKGGDYRYEFYLAISFAPNTVSADFMRKAMNFADKSAAAASQKIKDFFVADTHHPYRAEKLADGSFLICWQILKEREIYESKIDWLKNNVSLS